METGDILDTAIDPTQLPPLNQKRILAFVNHFLISTCTFLNEFGLQCEQRFIELERKLQKVEAGLVLLETKLATIPDDTVETEKNTTQPAPPPPPEATQTDSATKSEDVATTSSTVTTSTTETSIGSSDTAIETNAAAATTTAAPASGVRARDDARYQRFFKMLQFGVPAAAVKLKMKAEGLDSSILDTPELLLPDGVSA